MAEDRGTSSVAPKQSKSHCTGVGSQWTGVVQETAIELAKSWRYLYAFWEKATLHLASFALARNDDSLSMFG